MLDLGPAHRVEACVDLLACSPPPLLLPSLVASHSASNMGITPRTTFFVGLPLAEQPYYLALSAPSCSIVLTAAVQLLPLSSSSLVASPSAQLQEHPDLNKRKPSLSDSLQSTSTKSTAKPTTAQVAWLQPSLPSIFSLLDNAVQDAFH